MEEEICKSQESRTKGQETLEEEICKGQESRTKGQETLEEEICKSQESRTKGQETLEEEICKGQESRTKGQETLEEDIIYELSESGEGIVESGESCESGEVMEGRPSVLRTDNVDNDDNADKKLQRMIEEMGAETLLEIIRDNRNAAIRQIISEVEVSQDHDLQSGVSAASACNSIFDLAALA